MSPDRREDIESGVSELSEEEEEAGYHYCWDWDGLVVGPEDAEWGPNEECYCGHTHEGGYP